MNKGNPAEPIEILVLGDWVIDENWVLATHRSTLSTVEGKAHLRALGGLDSRMVTFCGAGRVSRFLYWMNRFVPSKKKEIEIDNQGNETIESAWIPIEDRQNTFSIFCLGTWSENDEFNLFSMFHPYYPQGLNPFSIQDTKDQSIQCKEFDGISLHNLSSACLPKDQEIGTTRIYRLYNLQAEAQRGIVMDRRVDFELRHKSIDDQASREYDDHQVGEILNKLKLIPKDQNLMSERNSLKYLQKDLERFSLHLATASKGAEYLPQLDSLKTNLNSSLSDIASSENPRVFKFVCIKDLGKGTVTKKLLEKLKEKELIDKNTQWFISSKRPNPNYLRLFKDPNLGSVRLFFLPPMSIAQTEREECRACKWFVADQEPTQDGMNKVKESYKYFLPPTPSTPLLVVAMPRGLSLLALENLGDDKMTGFYQPLSIINEIDAELTGRASMFFAVLVSQIINETPEPDPEERIKKRKKSLEASLGASHEIVKWNINEMRSRGSNDNKVIPIKILDLLSSISEGSASFEAKMYHFDWEGVNKVWEQSRNDTGIIFNNGGFTLDLWRAMNELDGYIEVVPSREMEIARLIANLKDFLEEPSRQNFSVLLVAEPGSGKSYLVSKLADALDMPPLTYNVAQLGIRQKVFECFDKIVSAQAHNTDHPHLVFFDEINAPVEHATVYDLFLTVLEDSAYLRDGQQFKLKKCAWIFAGTKELKSEPDETKEADFKSRLTIQEPVRLNRDATEKQKRLSLVYQAALQLQKQHSDVKRVSAEVLQAFYNLPKETSNRKIKQLAGQFRTIQYGEVLKKNLPDELKKALENRQDLSQASWELLLANANAKNNLDDILIEIMRKPDYNS